MYKILWNQNSEERRVPLKNSAGDSRIFAALLSIEWNPSSPNFIASFSQAALMGVLNELCACISLESARSAEIARMKAW
jgi:hypothetical protein